MKLTAILMILTSAASAATFDGQYFQEVWANQNYLHPITSTLALETFKGASDGACADVSLIWHHGDPKNTLLPQWLLNAGVQPISWGWVGGGGYSTTNHSATVNSGIMVNLAPSVLGPIATPLSTSSNAVLSAIGNAILGVPKGMSVALGPVWYAEPVSNGTLLPVNHWGSHADWGLGLSYAW